MNIDARAAANLMISYAANHDISLKHVSIQKMLYFSHAWYLLQTGKPLVYGYFEAWKHGPVHRTLYQSLKHHGREAVTKPIERVDPFTGEITAIGTPTDEAPCEVILRTVRAVGHLAPGRLIEMSHIAGGPWDHTWNISKTNPVLGNRISDSVTVRLFPRIKAAMNDFDRFGDVDEAEPVAPSGSRGLRAAFARR